MYRDEILHSPNREEILKRIGGDEPSKWKRLGAGIIGEAYAVSKDKVVKITSSLYEADTAAKLIGKDFPHIYKVLDAFRMETIDGTERGFIVTPRYRKLTKLETEAYKSIWNNLGCMDRYKTPSEAKNRLESLPASGEMKRDLRKYIKKFEWYTMLEELRQAGIPGNDTHYNNVMKVRDENGKFKYVLIDIST